jgi:hypothetical protein
MGFIFRKRIKTSPTSALNISGSGVSASKRVGPVTVSSRGRVSLRLGRGLSFRFKL